MLAAEAPPAQESRAARHVMSSAGSRPGHLKSRNLVAKDPRERLWVDVCARKDDGGGEALQTGSLLEEGGKAGGAGPLNDVVRIHEKRTHGFLDLVVGHLDDTIDAGPDCFERLVVRRAARYAVGDP